MENNELDKKQNIINLLRQYAQVQMINGYLSAKIMTKEGKEQVATKVSQTKDYITESAKTYGRKAQQMAKDATIFKEDKSTIISEYKAALEEINNDYTENMKNIMAAKEDLEVERQNGDALEIEMRTARAAVKKTKEYKDFDLKYKSVEKELMDALEGKAYGEVDKKNEELRELNRQNPTRKYSSTMKKVKEAREELDEMIAECENQLEECRINRNQQIEIATMDRKTAIANINKQNIFQKTVGSLINKFNGAKKFNSIIIESVGKKVDTIKKEYIPQVKETLQEKSTKVVAKAGEKVAVTREMLKTTTDKVTDKANVIGSKIVTVKDKVIENGKTSYKGLELKVANAKMYQINQMQLRLNKAKDAQREKLNQLQPKTNESKEQLEQEEL